MIRIVLTANPFPKVDDPDFVKEAYVGLVLTATSTIEPKFDPDYPHGAYAVAFNELIRALAEKHARAAQFMRVKWQPVIEAAEQMGKDVLIPIEFTVCRVVQ